MKQLPLMISLDLELLWGLKHRISSPTDAYLANIENVPIVMDKLISVFEDYKILACVGAVSAINFSNSNDLCEFLDSSGKAGEILSKEFDIFEGEKLFGQDMFYNPKLITRLEKSDFIRMGSHSFIHYNFSGGNNAELLAMAEIELSGKFLSEVKYNWDKFYIFPRNSYNKLLVEKLHHCGFEAYRGVANNFLYNNSLSNNYWKRGLRLVDGSFKIAEPSRMPKQSCNSKIFNDCATFFLRPVKSNSYFANMQLKRLISHVDYCASNEIIPHLWWHPHNFGKDIDSNVSQLVKFFDIIKEKYSLIEPRLFSRK